MIRYIVFLFNAFLLLNFASCTEVECPLDSVVVMMCGLYDAETKDKHTLECSLTISPYGKDTILLNAAQNLHDFVLPLKMGASIDTMLFHFADNWDHKATDTLVIHHNNYPHFESVECPANIFYNLTSVTWANDKITDLNVSIDSVAIVRNLVDFKDVENIQIYLRNTH